jgi:exodeoxyribonuclease-5
MVNDFLAAQIYANFGFTPTFGQKKTIEKLSAWVADIQDGDIFILNGYAGTGKTTLIAALVAALKELNIKSILLAPTGRAAKVVSRYTGRPAHTIHKKIYRQKSSALDSAFAIDFNKEADTLFIVDEGSMIGDRGDGGQFGSGSLLDDLVSYVRSGKRCRLLIVGDDAQLPPVGHDTSPALDPALMSRYGVVEYASMDEVVRQGAESGILFNATLVRCMIEAEIYEPPLLRTSFPDVQAIGGGEFIEEVESCYARYGRDETIVITRSNKRAGRFNQGIRAQVLWAENEIESGDMLMVVKNNYFHKELGEQMEFIANGDIARLTRIRRFEDLYGFRFAEARLEFPDYGDIEAEGLILLDTLQNDAPSLPREDSTRLYHAIAEDYPEITNKAKLYKKITEDPHYNALQVKFAYAVTCHKAQGGQWSAVFVDRMLFGDEPMSRDLMRWLYTALTRATEKLYLVNFDERFLE